MAQLIKLMASHTYKLIFIFCLLFSTSCSKITNNKNTHVSNQLDSPYTMPAEGYIALANNQEGTEKQALLILASGQLIYEGQIQKSAKILSNLKPLNQEIAAEKRLLQAKIALMHEQPNVAISRIADIHNIDSLPKYYQVQYYEMLATAYFLTKHPIEAVHERIKLESILSNAIAKRNNLLALWMALTTISEPEINILAAESPEDDILSGWIQLADISRKQNVDPNITIANIQKWQEKFPLHPGCKIISNINEIKNFLFPTPKKIALLLPLNGKLSGPGNAIKDGFMSAMENSPNRYNTNVQLYDTNAENIKNLYQQAIKDGADYIVGPLTKTDVAIIAKMEHPVPTLLLNETEFKPAPNAYQFGLSPTNEALQIASKMRKKSFGHTIVIAPSGTWGKEITDAFAKQFRQSGGQIVETFYFLPNDDLNNSIRELLHAIPDSRRKKRTENEVREPLRREDFDSIFLVAYPSQAKQIVPLLRYYYAGDIPVFATSNIYSGNINTMQDRDLNNVIFCDMPWVFDHKEGRSQNWPEQFNSYNRLYALGMDSYALATQLNQLLLFPAIGINNKSGIIYLNNNQEISRILVFGKFQNGEAILHPYF